VKQHERAEELKTEATKSLQSRLDETDLDFEISAQELIKITEECPIDFLARDPRRGNYQPVLYSLEVYENFMGNITYYYDKLIRPRL